MYSEYTCLDCGQTFDEPRRWEERHGLDTPPYEQFSGCPHCGGAYTHTILCDACGQPITGEYVKIQPTGDCFCDECFMMKSMDVVPMFFSRLSRSNLHLREGLSPLRASKV